jgi:protein deglycase
MNTVAIHLAEGFEETEAVSTIDVIRRAGVNVIIVSITGKLIVTGNHNISVQTDKLFEDVNYDNISMIILPGGMPGAKNLDNHDSLKQIIKSFYDKGKYLSAICAAPLVFGNLGILDGEKAVCYPGFEKHLKGADIQKDLVVESGQFITARGPGAALKFGIKIVERLLDKATAEKIGKAMLVN